MPAKAEPPELIRLKWANHYCKVIRANHALKTEQLDCDIQVNGVVTF
jgi:hypothetical protein